MAGAGAVTRSINHLCQPACVFPGSPNDSITNMSWLHLSLELLQGMVSIGQTAVFLRTSGTDYLKHQPDSASSQHGRVRHPEQRFAAGMLKGKHHEHQRDSA